MTEALALGEAALDLTLYEQLPPNKQAMARWLAAPVLEQGRERPSIAAYAEQEGMSKPTAYRLARDEEVLEAARDLIRTSVQVDKVPLLWQIVFEKALKSPDFALKVLKQLENMGFDTLMGDKSAREHGPKNQTVNIYAPGGLESAIIAMRRSRGELEDAG